MTAELEIIDRLMAEHQTNLIVKDADKSMGGFGVLLKLQEIQSVCKQTSINELINKKKQLCDALSKIQNHLDNHHFLEENALRPMVGELLMKALILEHSEIRNQIEQLILKINDCMPEDINEAELLAKKATLQEHFSNLCLTLEQHANGENQILRMLRQNYQRVGQLV